MDDVKRYTDSASGLGEIGEMVESDTGEWVRYRDFDRLRAELAAARAELADKVEYLEAYIEGQKDTINVAYDELRELKAELAKRGEPVAWMWEYCGLHFQDGSVKPPFLHDGIKAWPLYATPQPAQDDVADICNAYESGVGHAGRKTALVNPYKEGTAEHIAYAIGASGTKHNGTAQDDARDAERYRFLSSSHPIHDGTPFIARNFGASFSMWTGQDADREVDAAILAAKGGA
jgi:hypothetical protein